MAMVNTIYQLQIYMRTSPTPFLNSLFTTIRNKQIRAFSAAVSVYYHYFVCLNLQAR